LISRDVRYVAIETSIGDEDVFLLLIA